MNLGLTKEQETGAFEGVMPWLRATGEITRQVRAQLDRPLAAWTSSADHNMFDANDYFEGRRTTLEKKIAALAPRPMWRMERIWFPDSEGSSGEAEAYEQASVEIGGRLLHLRCLDAYTEFAYSCAGLREGEGIDDIGVLDGDLDEALEWAEAGVWLIQQSLPFPFRDVLQYSPIDNRPTIRLLFAYATLLRAKTPRKASPWFTALVYMDPEDRIGARYFAPGGTR